MNRAATQTKVAQLQHAELLRQHFYEQLFDLRQKAPAKVGNRVVVRMPVSGNESERERLIARTLDLPAAEDPRAAAIQEQGKENLRRIGLSSTRAKARIETAKIKLDDQINAV